ncbi:YtxH domain-containing protein [Clostridium senegalense]|uniref:YtxH domain-containing protein n=1 Tax=Clostridium senegalense TaxID=1465809 RepID=UPI001C0FDD1B|nr:YtxH domain-containing protein [Clostridium senegalense]MBU5225813.1 YtxH domain-containing protein [Clostridium senegalense]
MGMISKMQKRKKEEKKKAKRKQRGIAATTALIGSAIGVVGGILFAPKPGKETRKQIKDKAKSANETLRGNSIKIKDNVSEAKEKINAYLEEKKKPNFYVEKIEKYEDIDCENENCEENICEEEACKDKICESDI